MIIHNGSYIWFQAGQTARWGTINAIKALPYLMIAYQINGQWYSDPDFSPPKNLEEKPKIPINSAIIYIPKITVELQPIVQLCAGFRNKKIHSLWVVNAPKEVLKHILECNQWDSISPKQLLETLHELILYGYEVKILPAKKETISPIEWME